MNEISSSSKFSLVPFVINGGNATVFAYGQTGSGKTYTMTAMEELLSESLFACLRERNEDSLSVHVSFFEIYGGRCIDLLNSRKRLAVREDGRGQVQIAGLVRKEVRSETELREYIKRGNATRSTSKTEMNEASSRSHAICQLTIMDSAAKAVRGKYSLIDLAGSERASDMTACAEYATTSSSLEASNATSGWIVMRSMFV